MDDEQGWGATVVGGRPRRGRRVGRLVALAVLAVVGVYAVAGGAAALHAVTAMERVEVAGLQRGGGPLHVLVVGSDSRADLTEEQRRELTTGSAPGERTDTIFLLTIAGGRAGLLAFPRDLYVPRCDGSTGRINAAVAIAGPGCLVETVEALSGIGIDHYVEVSFLGFRDLVDAVGGVELCLDAPIADRDAGIDLPAGCQVLGGTDALGYVRVRKIDSDLDRIERQQRFLKALASEVASPATVLNPVRLYRTAGEIGAALTADRRLGPVGLARLGLGGYAMARGRAVTATVPVESRTRGGASVVVPVDSEAAALFAAFRDGSVLARAGTEQIPPEQVEVAVLNGSGVEGLARRVADTLAAEGFPVVEVGNAQPVDATVIRFPPGAEAGAATLAAHLPREVRREETGAVAAVTLVLGPEVAAAFD